MTYILPIQTFKTFVQGEINKILQKSGVEERHLVVVLTTLGPQEADKKENERVGCTKFLRKSPIFFANL